MPQLTLTLSIKPRPWTKAAVAVMAVVCAVVHYVSPAAAARLASGTGEFIAARGFSYEVD